MADEKPIVIKVVKVGDRVHLPDDQGPLAGLAVTVLAIDEEWVTVDAGRYGHVGCPIDDLVVPPTSGEAT
jgi:hypothetical protein